MNKILETTTDLDAARNGSRAQALGVYTGGGHAHVAGWLEPLALRSIVLVDKLQKERGVEGGMCEIGVHRARLLILLHLLSRIGERTVGFDLFELMGDSIATAYGSHSKQDLIASLVGHGCNLEDIDLVSIDSTELQVKDVLSHLGETVRIFSVDGGHDAETALSDMLLSARCMSRGGVVLLDDVFNEQWCGVVEAAARFMLRNDHELVPFLHAGNKMFFALGCEYAQIFREQIRGELTEVSTKTERFFGHQILIAWQAPLSKTARAVSLVLGEGGLRVLRTSPMISFLRRKSK